MVGRVSPLNGQPRSPQEYANFAGQVAERYKGKISAYEIWNEPTEGNSSIRSAPPGTPSY